MRLFYIAAIIITLLCLINNNYVNAEVDKKDLKKKSDLDSRVKSRLLCKMLYNVFTISTYQN